MNSDVWSSGEISLPRTRVYAHLIPAVSGPFSIPRMDHVSHLFSAPE